MLIGGIVMGVLAGSRFSMGAISYPGYYALFFDSTHSFVMAHISFAITMTIFTRNAITGFLFGLVIPNISQILEMILHFLKANIELNFLKLSALCHS